MNENNLIPLNQRTKEEQREIAKKGGKASGKARQEKKTMKQIAKMLLNMPYVGAEMPFLTSYNNEDLRITNLTAIIAKAIEKANKGDLEAMKFIRDTIGENPKYKIEETKVKILKKQTEKQETLADTWVKAILETENATKKDNTIE